jgi:hypothetical protein
VAGSHAASQLFFIPQPSNPRDACDFLYKDVICVEMSNVPLGPLGQIFEIKKSGVIGKCVASYWPISGASNGVSIKLKTLTGAIYEVPLFSVKRATDKQRQDFLRQSR